MGQKASDAEYLKYFGQALANPDGWKAGDKEFLVCQVCSYVSTDLTLKQCPICSAPREKFVSFK
jgi:rubrerythrin